MLVIPMAQQTSPLVNLTGIWMMTCWKLWHVGEVQWTSSLPVILGGGVQGPPGAPLTEPEPMKQPNLGFGNSLTHLSRSSLLSVQPLPLYSSSYTTLPFMIAIFFNHPNNPLRQWGYSHSADETTEAQRSSLACLMPCCSIVEGQKKDVVPDLTASRPKGRPAPLSCGLFWKKNSVHSVDFALGTRSAHQPQRYPFPDPFHPRAEFSNPRPL